MQFYCIFLLLKSYMFSDLICFLFCFSYIAEIEIWISVITTYFTYYYYIKTTYYTNYILAKRKKNRFAFISKLQHTKTNVHIINLCLYVEFSKQSKFFDCVQNNANETEGKKYLRMNKIYNLRSSIVSLDTDHAVFFFSLASR